MRIQTALCPSCACKPCICRSSWEDGRVDWEDIEYDIVLKMPPIKSYTIMLEIVNVRKGRLNEHRLDEF